MSGCAAIKSARSTPQLTPIALALLIFGGARDATGQQVPWPRAEGSVALERRVAVPEGYRRIAVEPGSLGEFLRQIPVKAGRPSVRLFDGREKANQDAHALVLDVDVGKKDLQQCADFAIRMFAEHRRARGADLCFRFTSGHEARWSAWAAGSRPLVRGSKVTWKKSAPPSDGYESFRAYLDVVMTYAGTFSLARDLAPVADRKRISPGDLFVKGGFPGHAVLVMDVAEDDRGERLFLLAQSFMPAQEPHLLVEPSSGGLWYRAVGTGELLTPEWAFDWADLRRVPVRGCPGLEP